MATSRLESDHFADDTSSTEGNASVVSRRRAAPAFEIMDCQNYDWAKDDLTDLGQRRRELLRWHLVGFVAVSVALIGALVECAITNLNGVKFGYTESLTSRKLVGRGLFFYVVFNLVACSVATFCVLAAPRAKGSGIPEIKCYLNGVKVREVIAEKTLVAKLIGVVGSVSGGLVCGKEGPMVHIGAVIGAVVSQGRPETFGRGRTTRSRTWKFLNTEREKRDFVAIGTACGVASAFGSVIGGVLFMIEEASSYWNQKLFFRATYASTVNVCFIVFLLQLFRDPEHPQKLFDRVKFQGMAVFENFDDDELDFKDRSASLVVLLLTVAVGAVLGAWGAAFNAANKKITKWRMKFYARYPSNNFFKLLEVLLVATVISLTSYCVPLATSEWCRPLEEPSPFGVRKHRVVRFQCEKGHYNEFATLSMASLSDSITSLFHANSVNAFSFQALALHFATTSLFACVTYGLHVPSGLFLPSILCGATFGRLVGLAVVPSIFKHNTRRNLARVVQDLTVAGGIAGLAGTTRMTVSIVAIFLSTILDGTHVVPVFVAALASKIVGDVFNEGLYEIHIELQKYPYITDVPPLAPKKEAAAERQKSRIFWHDNTVEAVMSRNVHCFSALARYADVVATLRRTSHNAFPVVQIQTTTTSMDDGTFVGLITRDQLLVVLAESRRSAPYVYVRNDGDTRDYFPRFPDIDDLPSIDAIGPDAVLDLNPYTNKSALTARPETSLLFANVLFRTLMLRHLVVLNEASKVCGIVTRRDLMRMHLGGGGDCDNDNSSSSHRQRFNNENPRAANHHHATSGPALGEPSSPLAYRQPLLATAPLRSSSSMSSLDTAANSSPRTLDDAQRRIVAEMV